MCARRHSATSDLPEGGITDNIRVSKLSYYSDELWDFSSDVEEQTTIHAEKILRWNFQVNEGHSFTDPEYSLMYHASKQLCYVLMFGSKQNNFATVFKRFNYIKIFIRFLAARPNPPYRFQDVLQSDLSEFIEYYKERPGKGGKGTTSALTIANVLAALNPLHDEKEHLVDHLRFRPSGRVSAYEATGTQGKKALERRYLPIPDPELSEILNICLDYIDNKAPQIIKCVKDFNQFISMPGFEAKTRGSQRYNYGAYFFPHQEVYKSSPSLNAALINLRTACFIVIAFSTGMRLSEILAMKRECIREELTSNHGVFYWIDSKLYKTQRMRAGTKRSWMCGPLAAQAVQLLERLGDAMNISTVTDFLFFSFNHFIKVTKVSFGSRVGKISPARIGIEIKDFCARHGLNTNLHPHRLRRSFARNIIRHSSTSILALRDHFKHWSLYMTDWYVGLDPDLIEDLEAERILLSVEATERICTQVVGGPGGRRWTVELDERIRKGILPRNFKGKAGAEFRKKMIRGLHESGMIVTPCGDFTYCVFQKDRALCTSGEHPVVNRCNPLDCRNSFVLAEHAAAYERRLAELRRLYAGLSPDEKKGPAGLFYLREMKKTMRILEPFIDGETREA